MILQAPHPVARGMLVTESVMPWMLEEAKGKKALALRVLRVCCEAWDVMVMMVGGDRWWALDRWALSRLIGVFVGIHVFFWLKSREKTDVSF